jgi:hypothetical protein
MTTPTKKPAKSFRLGSITLAIWANTDRHGRTFYTTSLSRSYRDEAGQWHSIGNLHSYDLPVVRELTTRAQDWLHAQASGAESATDAAQADSALGAPTRVLDEAARQR